jgi:hypothetical protein
MPEWLPIAKPLRMTYNRNQGTDMVPPILGVVLHTTNTERGDQTLERFQSDWQKGQQQSAHFMVDRHGFIGQFRALSEIAWHIHGPSKRYIGIEHIALWLPRQDRAERLEHDQIEKSAELLVALAKIYVFPIQPLAKPGDRGIGVHEQFEGTSCGRGVLCKRLRRGQAFKVPDDFEDDYFRIMARAAERLRREDAPDHERDFPGTMAVPGRSQGPGRPIVPRWI